MGLLFWRELRSRWIELALGTLAIAAIVTALVTQRAVTESAEDAVHGLAHNLGRNMLLLPAGADPVDFYAQRYGDGSLPAGLPERLRSSPVSQHIGRMDTYLYGNLVVQGAPLVLVGNDGLFQVASAAPMAVLGPAAAQRLGLGPGSQLRAGEVTLSVVHVDSHPVQGLDEAIFVPLATAQRILGRPGQVNAARLGGCWCRIDVAALGAQIEKLAPGVHAVTVASMLQAQKGTVGTMKRFGAILLAAGLALMAGLIAALVTSQLRRRRRELGLLAALGASPTVLARAFALQAGVAGAVGGLFGWLLAHPAAAWLGARALGHPLAPATELLLPSVLLAAVVSIAAAWIPARRAAALDPTVVLREL